MDKELGMNFFTIRDLENLSGIKAHTIRIWEQRYHLFRPLRTETNIRCYDNEELKMLLIVALLHKYGFKISHIHRMSAEEIREQVLALTPGSAQLERLVIELLKTMIDLDLEQFERLLDNYIVREGMAKTILQLVFPFLEKIGLLRTTGHVNPAQEHLVTTIIRQKIIVGIERAVVHQHKNISVLLFLPEGEYHELGLLSINYLLKVRGVKTLYLGANLPVEDVVCVLKHKKTDYVCTHLTVAGHCFDFDHFIRMVSHHIQNIPVVIAGHFVPHCHKRLPRNIHLKKSLDELTSFINQS